jgi:hypothetical protein
MNKALRGALVGRSCLRLDHILCQHSASRNPPPSTSPTHRFPYQEVTEAVQAPPRWSPPLLIADPRGELPHDHTLPYLLSFHLHSPRLSPFMLV